MKFFKLINEGLKKAILRIYEWIEGPIWGTTKEEYDDDIIEEEDEDYTNPDDDDYGGDDYP